MKKIVAALLAVFALSTYANDPWPAGSLQKPRYWDTYPREFTQPLARACRSDKDHLPPQVRDALCVCIIWQVENYISFDRLRNKPDGERQGVLIAANEVCAELFSK